MNIQIRPIKPDEYPLLSDFFYLTIFVSAGEEKPPYEIIFEPKINLYFTGFGGKNDCGVVAENDGKIVGIAWTRIEDTFGHIDDNTPELAISLLPEYRGQGIGTKLLEFLFTTLRKSGYKRTSLSAHKDNPAMRLYSRLGYQIIGEATNDAGHTYYTMVKELG